ncbi:MAG: hypothetical protein R3E02_01910 [Blastomonas sp.]
MTAQSSIFPIHIKPEYQGGMPALDGITRDISAVSEKARQQFERDFTEVAGIVRNALGTARNAAGALDLGTDRLQESARNAQIYATGLREVEQAARSLAVSTGDTSEETRRYLQAATEAAREAERSASALRQKAATYERLQSELNQTASATQQLITAERGYAGSSRQLNGALGQQRFAMIQIGQQLQDITVGLQGGQRAATVFAQQIPQLSFALIGFEKSANKALAAVGRLGTFLSGPWGAAILIATTVIGNLTAGLIANANAHEGAKEGADANREATSALSEAIDKLDEVTGRLNQSLEQTRVQLALEANEKFNNAIATRELIKQKLLLAEANLRVSESALGPGATSADFAARAGSNLAELRALRKEFEQNENDIAKARAGFKYLLQPGRGFRLYEERRQAYRGANDSGGRSGGGSGRSSGGDESAIEREAKRLADLSKATADIIAGINRQFGEQPRLIDESRAAVATLDAQLKELLKPENAGLPDLDTQLNELMAARALAADAVNAEFDKLVAENERQIDLQKLIVQGREEEVEILERIADFEQRNGDLGEARKQIIAEQVVEMRRLNAEINKSYDGLNLIVGLGNGGPLQFLSNLISDPRARTGADGPIGEFLFGTRLRQGDQEKVVKGITDGYLEATEVLNRQLESLFARFLSGNGELASAIGQAAAGAQYGGDIARLLSSIGIKTDSGATSVLSGLGTLISGSASVAGPLAIGSAISQQIGKALGFNSTATGIGGLVGGFLHSVVSSTKRGSAIIGGSGSALDVVGFYGNSGKRKEAAGGLAGEAISIIQQIADQLGGTVNAALGKVSIGYRKDEIFVDPQGRGYTKASKFSDIRGFGEDTEAAIRFAVADLIGDNVLQGIRLGSQRLLKNSKDIESGIADAHKFENVFKELDAIRDPLKAGLTGLDNEFRDLIDVFQRAGATVEELGNLEELYGIRRKELIEQITEQELGTLNDLLKDLTTGNSALSLRDRRASALEAYNPLAAAIQAGEKVDNEKFTQAARDLLAIERDLFGSQGGYFDRLGQITGLTTSARDNALAGLEAASSGQGLFGEAALVENAINNQTAALSGQLGILIESFDSFAARLLASRNYSAGVFGGGSVGLQESRYLSQL